MKIFLATDHAGFELKEQVKSWLQHRGYDVQDYGAHELMMDDNYPDYIHPMCRQLLVELRAELPQDHPLVPSTPARGIVFGGSGEGEAMVCNRHHGLRATVYYGHDLEIVRLGRKHNNANILSIGARFINADECSQAIDIFLSTEFEGGRHTERVNDIDAL